ncbi:MAG: TolC family protein [Spirochaetes bacterium]|nr:TolC family protein [Spirochaetota bacterium]
MKLKVISIIFIAIFFSQISQSAFSAEAKIISVREAVDIALKNSHEYKLAELKFKEADENVNSVWGQLFPVLESEVSAVRQHADKGMMSLSDGQFDVKLVQVGFGINPGIFYNSLKASRSLYIASKEDIRRIKNEIELNVIKSYFSLILTEEMIALRKSSVELLKSNLKDVQNMHSTGTLPKFDLLQAKVQLNSQIPLLLEAENNYRAALNYFNYVIGSGEIYKSDISILNNKIEPVSQDGMEQKIDMLISAALKNRPEFIQLQKKVEASGHIANMYESYYIWPTFTVGGYYGLTKNDANNIGIGDKIPPPVGPALGAGMSDIFGYNKWQDIWQVRVAATYRWGSLLGMDSNSSFAKGSELAAKQAEEEMLKLKRLIAINIDSIYSRLVTSYMTILSQKENVDTAIEGLRIARESFKAGVIKNSDLISSDLAFTTAKTSYINAVNSYYTALAELKNETGLNDDSIIFEKVK